MASSLLVCFVGFQMTIGLSPEQVCKLAVLLVAATSEIYLICYFSDLLMTAVSIFQNKRFCKENTIFFL